MATGKQKAAARANLAKARAAQKRGKGRATRVYRRAAGFARRHKWAIPSIGGGTLLLATARRFGWFQALLQALNGQWGAALTTLMSRATVGNVLPIAAGGIGLTMARGAFGPIPITKVGRWTIRVL